MTINLPHNFTPRPYQLPFLRALDSGINRVVIVWNRRSGKDVCTLNWCIKKLMTEVATCFYVMPTYSQGKKVIWDSVNNDGFRFLDYFPKEIIANKNNQEMKIRLINGSLFQVIGSDNIDSLMGTNPKIVVFSEYALQDPAAWEYIRPILKVNGGVAIFISTPRGRNHFYDLFRTAQTTDGWFSQKLTVEDTKVLTKEDVEKEMAEGMSYELAQQEYYCFPSGQFVMTSEGMKDIKDISPGMLVMTHKGRFRKVLETTERDYEGNLVRIKSYGSGEDLLCTPNHPIRVYERHSQSFRWIQAEFIKEKYRLFFPKMSFSGDYLSLNFLKMMAWYICEGSSGFNHLQFSVCDIEEAEYVSNICKVCGYDPIIRKVETGVNVIINDTYLVDTLKSLCGNDAESKRIPLYLLGVHASVFFEELVKGDGCRHINKGQERINFVTISKSLAYQVQILANSLGYTSGISTRIARDSFIQGRGVKCKKSYQVQIGSVKIRQESTKLIRGKYGIGACVKNVSFEPFCGKVYNFKVQFDESYLVNGRAVHNCSFERGVDGSYYSKLITLMREQERIGSFLPDPYRLTHVSFDLGWDDSTALVFFQVDGSGNVRIIDYEEHNTKTLAWYKELLMSKGYKYGTYLFPHDVEHVDGLGSGCTRRDILEDLQIPVTTVPRGLVADGIETVKSLMSSRLYINESKCHKLIKSLEGYHREWDEKHKVYSSKPKHDSNSHCSDAVRYLATGLHLVQGASSGSLKSDYDALRKYWGG